MHNVNAGHSETFENNCLHVSTSPEHSEFAAYHQRAFRLAGLNCSSWSQPFGGQMSTRDDFGVMAALPKLPGIVEAEAPA